MLPRPTDHDADSYYEVTLTATDSQGRTDAKTIKLLPETINLTLASSPGRRRPQLLRHRGDGATTAPRRSATVATVTAPDTYVIGGQTYQFSPG